MPRSILVRYSCGCRVSCGRAGYSITYCPKHKAAPDMYEALMKFPNHVTAGNYTVEQIQQLIRNWRNNYWYKALDKANPRRKYNRWYRCMRCASVFDEEMAKWTEGEEKTCPKCGWTDIVESAPCVKMYGVGEKVEE